MSDDLLPGPMELLELPSGEELSFRVERFEEGETEILPRGETVKKRIGVLRVFVPAGSKSHGAPWWDITSTTLMAQLKPFLSMPDAKSKLFTVKASGVRPAKRYSLQVT
jgi:hypothetical protein